MFIVVLFYVAITLNFSQTEADSSSLQLVITLFRHGERTNAQHSIYPKDPHWNETYAPYGLGQLTNKGKLRMYDLGQKLREMYDNHLGSYYQPDSINAVSTDFDRTKASLQLFLAGLFPPEKTPLLWKSSLNWDPIPYNYLPVTNNLLMLSLSYCSNYIKLYEKYKKSPEGIRIGKKYDATYPYISKNSGSTMKSTIDLAYLYFGLTTEQEFGLKLPDWTSTVYPDFLESAVKDTYRMVTATPALKQLFGGFLLKKIVSDMRLKIDNKTSPKMFVYSGHEYNVATLLGAMNVYYPHVPEYGACIIFELHKMKNDYYVKVLYNDNFHNNFKELVIPGCKLNCRFTNFTYLLQENMPCDGNPCEEECSEKLNHSHLVQITTPT